MWHTFVGASRSHRRTALRLASASAISWGSLKTCPFCPQTPQHVSCDSSVVNVSDAQIETLPSWIVPMVRHTCNDGMDIDRKAKMTNYDHAQRSLTCHLSNKLLPPAPPSGHPSRLRLVTYNVHFMRDNDMQPNLDRVLEAVRTMDADVVAMQEVALPIGLAKSSTKVRDGDADGFNECMISIPKEDGEFADEVGTRFANEMFKLGYEHVVYTPSFCPKAVYCAIGNAVFSRRPWQDHKAPANSTVTLDLKRSGFYPGVGEVACTRNAAVAVIGIGKSDTSLEPVSVTIASVHLDVLAECGTNFGLAEGEFVRLLEFEALNDAVRDLPNVIVAGDFNAPAKSTSRCTPIHNRLGQVLEQLAHRRDAHNARHFKIGEGDGPRLKEEWCFTALEFAEHRLGYRHAWQLLQPEQFSTVPLYSHWSGQLIDHCLFRNSAPVAPREGNEHDKSIQCVTHFVGIFHTDASDHLPLVVDIEFLPASHVR